VGYVPLDAFAAAVAAADAVVVPSERASQSGVLALARRLGVPTVAADVGGLSELASRTFVAGDVADLNRALEAELGTAGPAAAGTAPSTASTDEELAVDTHLRAYRRVP
jgi:glycosyltransferase involved in cell wall biosynthesis